MRFGTWNSTGAGHHHQLPTANCLHQLSTANCPQRSRPPRPSYTLGTCRDSFGTGSSGRGTCEMEYECKPCEAFANRKCTEAITQTSKIIMTKRIDENSANCSFNQAQCPLDENRSYPIPLSSRKQTINISANRFNDANCIKDECCETGLNAQLNAVEMIGSNLSRQEQNSKQQTILRVVKSNSMTFQSDKKQINVVRKNSVELVQMSSPRPPCNQELPPSFQPCQQELPSYAPCQQELPSSYAPVNRNYLLLMLLVNRNCLLRMLLVNRNCLLHMLLVNRNCLLHILLQQELPSSYSPCQQELPSSYAPCQKELPSSYAPCQKELPSSYAPCQKELPSSYAPCQQELSPPNTSCKPILPNSCPASQKLLPKVCHQHNSLQCNETLLNQDAKDCPSVTTSLCECSQEESQHCKRTTRNPRKRTRRSSRIRDRSTSQRNDVNKETTINQRRSQSYENSYYKRSDSLEDQCDVIKILSILQQTVAGLQKEIKKGKGYESSRSSGNACEPKWKKQPPCAPNNTNLAQEPCSSKPCTPELSPLSPPCKPELPPPISPPCKPESPPSIPSPCKPELLLSIPPCQKEFPPLSTPCQLEVPPLPPAPCQPELSPLIPPCQKNCLL
ncbi:uncharacterized protein LOC110181178 isoform X2 [Drosophila serrata]|uniref:uncharacterized protein LOC110181178 isoform X2 n=1 Tax=Drosophila serrata TaxID=7274 RepID=UPI000A1CFAE6|nr:uncharacterized protein LOC110181178 isoform X2 [Drosophila serrata]